MSLPPVPDGWTTAEQLGARLGISAAVARRHARAAVPWLPQPYRIAGRWVWRTDELDGVEERRRGAGRPKGAKDRKPRVRRSTTTPTTETAQQEQQPAEGEQRL